MSFRSRWIELPVHATELGGGLAPGFRAAGVRAGIKPSGDFDLGLLVSDAAETVSAARFTRSGAAAAPIELCRTRCRLDALRAVVVNSGNANAATGARGRDDAAKMQGAAAMAAGVSEDRVAVASTGVIGVPLPIDDLPRAIRDAREQLAADGDPLFWQAIKTTDAIEKRIALKLALPAGEVRLTAQAKGAGMIEPGFATLLCFIQTDAILDAATADLLLGVCVKRSFDRISVDGQLSTNDAAILMASGQSGIAVAAESEDERRFGEALDYALRRLALLIIRDGEGSERTGRVEVRGGDQVAAEAVARSIANSPLVKAALNGGDPNWGRVAQAIGAAIQAGPMRFAISIDGVKMCEAGAVVDFVPPQLVDEVDYLIELPGEGAATEVFFSDLSHGYVSLNAEYTT